MWHLPGQSPQGLRENSLKFFCFVFNLLSQVLSKTLGSFALACVTKPFFESQINQPQESLHNICAEILFRPGLHFIGKKRVDITKWLSKQYIICEYTIISTYIYIKFMYNKKLTKTNVQTDVFYRKLSDNYLFYLLFALCKRRYSMTLGSPNTWNYVHCIAKCLGLPHFVL